jgi:hypothetical protein
MHGNALTIHDPTAAHSTMLAVVSIIARVS